MLPNSNSQDQHMVGLQKITKVSRYGLLIILHPFVINLHKSDFHKYIYIYTLNKLVGHIQLCIHIIKI